MRIGALLGISLTFAAAPGQASNSFTVYCEGGGFKQLVKEGNEIRDWMRGFGTLPFWCAPNRRIEYHAVGLDGEALATLRLIAALDEPDEARVGDKVAWRDDDTPLGEAARNAVGWDGEGTFGQLRAQLARLAVPTGEYVEDTGFRTYRSENCAEPLIPLRYYLNAKAPFPGCGGEPLIKAEDDVSYFD